MTPLSAGTPQHGATHPPGYSDATCYLFDLSNNTGTHLSPAERSLNGTFSTELYAAGTSNGLPSVCSLEPASERLLCMVAEAVRIIKRHSKLHPEAEQRKPLYFYVRC